MRMIDDNFSFIWRNYGYFMIHQLEAGNMGYKNRRKLLMLLHSVPFRYTIQMDRNRVGNAIYFREEYMRDNHIVLDIPDNMIMGGSCSILELLFVFALKIDREYTSDDFDDHPEILFWQFIENLGLFRFTDRKFNSEIIYNVLDIWMNREYYRNGEGGNIFIVENPNYDLSGMQLWDQMQLYVTEWLAKERS